MKGACIICRQRSITSNNIPATMGSRRKNNTNRSTTQTGATHPNNSTHTAVHHYYLQLSHLRILRTVFGKTGNIFCLML